MKIYSTIKELVYAPIEIHEHMQMILGEYFEDNKDIPEEDLFEWALGGLVYELEDLDDLKEIETHRTDPHDLDRWLTLAESAGEFDAVDELTDYTVIFSAVNNSGGPTYFIPNWIKVHCPHVQETIELNQ